MMPTFRPSSLSFFACSYILAVNASIVSETGGGCTGTGDEYALCVNVVRRDLTTATAAIAALASFFMGLLSNL